MARFYLTREFHEIDGLELVAAHWMVAAPGAAPDWSGARAVALQAFKTDSGWIRRGALDVDCEGNGPWVLHYFFDWVRRGVYQRGPAYVENVVAREVIHREPSTEYSHASLVYNLGDSGWTNVVPMVLEGAPLPSFPCPEFPEEPGTSLADRKLREAAARLTPPLKFKADVLGPSGAQVLYSIHLARKQGLNPMADRGKWIPRLELVL